MHHAFNYVYLGVTLAGLGLATVAIHILGFAGVPAGMVIADGIITVWAMYLCHKKLAFVPLSSLLQVLLASFYLKRAKTYFSSRRLIDAEK
jgi:hypothetical protein